MSGGRGETRLAVEGLTISAGGRRLAGPVDLSLSAGHCLSVVGETGAGKSLIAQALLGMLPDGVTAEGAITLDGSRIDRLAPRARARLWGRTLSLLPQEPWRALDPTMRAFAQVQETHRHVAGLDDPAARAATARDFTVLGLDGAEGKLPGALSGGMAQRVAFAATRAGGAPILLADEPTKGLDAALRDDVIRLLREAMQAGAALLVITHDVAVARGLGGDLLILRDGHVEESGRTEAVLSAPSSDYGRTLVMADPAFWPQRETAPEGEVVLGTRSLAVERGGRCLVEGLALEIRAGERLAVEGPSGSGKSSLLDTLAGLLKPASGSVERGPGVEALGVQKLYQDPPAAFPPRVSLGQLLKDLAQRHAIDQTRIKALLDRLRVPLDLLERRPDAVSGGELQRIALARILALRPRVILADEPTSRLDPVTQRDVMALIADVAEETRAAVVLVTHDPVIAGRWADRRLSLGT